MAKATKKSKNVEPFAWAKMKGFEPIASVELVMIRKKGELKTVASVELNFSPSRQFPTMSNLELVDYLRRVAKHIEAELSPETNKRYLRF